MAMAIRGLIFDLDGTLVDSQLDFDQIRRDLGFPERQPILETFSNLPPGSQKDRCAKILNKHELQGARRARLMPEVDSFLQDADRRGLFQGVLTRNSREAAELVLDRLGLNLSPVLTRDDVPPKPDPTGLLTICRTWDISVDEVLFFGDYLFDLQAGSNAGMATVLYAPGDLPAFATEANFIVRSFSEASELLARLLNNTK